MSMSISISISTSISMSISVSGSILLALFLWRALIQLWFHNILVSPIPICGVRVCTVRWSQVWDSATGNESLDPRSALVHV